LYRSTGMNRNTGAQPPREGFKKRTNSSPASCRARIRWRWRIDLFWHGISRSDCREVVNTKMIGRPGDCIPAHYSHEAVIITDREVIFGTSTEPIPGPSLSWVSGAVHCALSINAPTHFHSLGRSRQGCASLARVNYCLQNVNKHLRPVCSLLYI
jgi:hypothetical protein